MRIIAGEFRSRKLISPSNDTTRPVTDRVKQSIFDCLASRIGEACVYDCFAGAGSMGLECLSRGSRQVTFFEADREALAGLHSNMRALGVSDRSTVVAGNIFQWFAAAPAPVEKVGLIFLDPPYHFLKDRSDDLCELAKKLAERHRDNDAILVFRHHGDDVLALPGWEAIDARDYGSMRVEFLGGPRQVRLSEKETEMPRPGDFEP